jgi:hypothetical protein
MIDVLYVNHGHSERCGVHDLGRRHAEAIVSEQVDVAYVECNTMAEFDAQVEAFGPDVIIVNYMSRIMPWVTEAIHRHGVTTIAVIHNYQHDTIDRVAADHHRLFDFVLALDPTLHATNPWVLTTDRPLPDTVELGPLPDTPRIGSFGFAFPHKNFPAVAAEIAATFDAATFDLHMPEAFFNGNGGRPARRPPRRQHRQLLVLRARPTQRWPVIGARLPDRRPPPDPRHRLRHVRPLPISVRALP